MKDRCIPAFLLLWICVCLGACSLGGVEIKLPKTLPRVDLGEDTLRRIDDINARLASGLEIGPETRQEIDELNRTLRQVADAGIGLNEATLSRIDALLARIEAGVGITVGLDDRTRATLNGLVDAIDRAPDQWGTMAQEIIRALEGSTASVAHQMAQEVKSVIEEAQYNAKRLTAAVGSEFRCNVDFLIGKVDYSLDAFIGRSIVGRLRAIIAGEQPGPAAPLPWVCQIIPDQLALKKAVDRLEAERVLITITGYNFTDANLPGAYLTDEGGQRLSFAPLFPYRTSPYQIGLNLQGHDFAAVPMRARVVFDWPGVGTVELPIVRPEEPTPVPTAEVVAELEITEDLEVRFGPGANYRAIGRAEHGARYRVIGRNGEGTWWQIDYAGKVGWVPADKAARNDIAVPVASAFPAAAPAADFSVDPKSGVAPLTVRFTDRSSGSPSSWQWAFGDGGTASTQNPTHVYETAGTWQVRLTVANDQGQSSQVDQIVVEAPTPTDIPTPPPPAPVAAFRPSITDGYAPASVSFEDLSQGSPTRWLWDFGDRTGPSTDRNPTHVYEAPGVYEACLTASNEGGDSPRVCTTILVRAFRPGSIFFSFYGYDRLPPGEVTNYDTGIKESEYTCGIVGVSVEGDIDESSASGDLIAAYMEPVAGTWRINARFRTHGNPQRWQVWIMCLDNAAAGPNGFVRLSYRAGAPVNDAPWNYEADTGMATDKYYCAIAGYAASGGDIQEKYRSRILELLLDGSGPTWKVEAYFNTQEGRRETWRLVHVLCVNREPGVFEYGEFAWTVRDVSEHATPWSGAEYYCGIAGMRAYDGDIWEDGYGYILRAFMHVTDGTWYAATAFRTHEGAGELWDANVLCVLRGIAGWR